VLGLGLVDARNTRLEPVEALLPLLDRVGPRLGPTAYLNPSSGLELLPRARARAKLETLARLARAVAGPGGAAA
jgi:methionine synthase II (cobalamin-independent)